LIIVAWVVGALVLYIRGRRHEDHGHVPDPDVQSRRRLRDDQKYPGDGPPPW
jgi:hypothetical protein